MEMVVLNMSNQDTLEFRQIVLTHLQRILELSSHEFRNKSTTILKGNYMDTIDNEDTRVSYYQSIEHLSLILMPYFDERMYKVYGKCTSVMNEWGYRLKQKFKQEWDEVQEDIKPQYFVHYLRQRYAKKLFAELNLLLHRQDYLKSTIYGEDAKDEMVSDVGDKNE